VTSDRGGGIYLGTFQPQCYYKHEMEQIPMSYLDPQMQYDNVSSSENKVNEPFTPLRILSEAIERRDRLLATRNLPVQNNQITTTSPPVHGCESTEEPRNTLHLPIQEQQVSTTIGALDRVISFE